MDGEAYRAEARRWLYGKPNHVCDQRVERSLGALLEATATQARNAALEEAAALQNEEVRRLVLFARDSRCRDYICDAREAKDRAIAIRALKTDGGGDGI